MGRQGGSSGGSSGSSWGEVNRVMNRLVAEGVIAGYRSNAADAGREGPLAIELQPADGRDGEDARREALRRLARLGVVASVRTRPSASA